MTDMELSTAPSDNAIAGRRRLIQANALSAAQEALQKARFWLHETDNKGHATRGAQTALKAVLGAPILRVAGLDQRADRAAVDIRVLVLGEHSERLSAIAQRLLIQDDADRTVNSDSADSAEDVDYAVSAAGVEALGVAAIEPESTWRLVSTVAGAPASSESETKG